MAISDLRAHSGRGLRLAGILLAVVLLTTVGLRLVRGDGYQLQLVFPSAPVVVEGLVVQVDGFDAGKVTDLEAKDGQAVVTVTLEPPYDEMPQGSTAQIEWKAVLGERVIGICDSPIGLARRALGSIGVEHGPDVELEYAGLNHLGWLTTGLGLPLEEP